MKVIDYHFPGLVIRLMVSQLAVLGGDLSLKERLFVALAWLPKATVQATAHYFVASSFALLEAIQFLLRNTYKHK